VPDAQLNPADTAWLLTATALVLFMTIPGLAIFYGGLVRAKNVLSVLMQCLTITALVTVLWVAYGYSLAFGLLGLQIDASAPSTWLGGISKLFLRGVTSESLVGGVPESVFVTFQMTFAIITPALIIGAFAERMKFSAMLLFTALWLTIVYLPICHMVWGGGLLSSWGVLDYAGGTVVHINAGVAGLVACIVLGKRTGYPKTPFPPHNLGYSLIGASLLWVGWFGFNAGSAWTADAASSVAMLNTQVATALAALVWMLVEMLHRRKASMLGLASGAIAGLVAITPAAGLVSPQAALVIGAAAGVAGYFGAVFLKRMFGYDDSLDVFGIHGVCGIVGAILTGVFAQGDGVSMPDQVMIQITAVGATIAYCAIVTAVILLVLKFTIGLRVSEDAEVEGLDSSLHGETVH
jgi:Amt family ammonium transporter